MSQRGAGIPCTIDADVVQFEANGAPHTRAALVPYLSRFTLAGVTGFFTHKAVRHSLLAKLTIPITTVRSAHTAMIVWVSIGFSDLSKLPRATKHRTHYSAPAAYGASRKQQARLQCVDAAGRMKAFPYGPSAPT